MKKKQWFCNEGLLEQKNINLNEKFNKNNMICLRPAPHNAIEPFEINKLIGKKARRAIKAGDIIRWQDVI